MAWDARTYDRQFSFVTEYGAALIGLLDPQQGERILDLGCGTGHQTAELTDLGVEAVGLDSDAAMIERAREEHPGTTYVLGEAQSLTARGALSQPFDAVISNAALHWMADQAAVLAGVRSLLRIGGRFVAEQGGVGNVALTWAALTGAAGDVGLPAPVLPWVFPTPAEQATRLEAAGFAVRLVQHFDRPTPLAPEATTATWAEMFGRTVLDGLDATTRQLLLERVNARAQEAGLRTAEGWWADYTRLRFVAEAS